MRIARSLLGSVIAVAALALSALPTPAQSWPTGAVKLILPLGPGSGVDIGARLHLGSGTIALPNRNVPVVRSRAR